MTPERLDTDGFTYRTYFLLVDPVNKDIRDIWNSQLCINGTFILFI